MLNSKPINHFTLEESATMSLLMGGGIGVTPMIALAYELHAQGRLFVPHSSAIRPDGAGFVDDLKEMLWSDKLCFHFSDQGTRADLDEVLSVYQNDWHVYTCGPEQFMTAVLEAAERQGFPEKARHLEYFSVPEQPDYENHEITL